MKTKRISHNWDNRIRPHIEGNSIVYMELPASVVLADDNVVVIDYFDYRESIYERRELHFFLDGPIKVDWDDLTDDQRLGVRTSLKNIVTMEQLVIPLRYLRYTDDRYYILEALSG